jgi:hypothetical protein
VWKEEGVSEVHELGWDVWISVYYVCNMDGIDTRAECGHFLRSSDMPMLSGKNIRRGVLTVKILIIVL